MLGANAYCPTKESHPHNVECNVPSISMIQMHKMNVNPTLCQWVLNYLRQRPQRVRVNNFLSTSRYTSIGAPQGCVLSPVLFTIYTNEHRSDNEEHIIIKYADDTAVVGLMNSKTYDAFHRAVKRFVAQCSDDDLILNVQKTKELVIDFRRAASADYPPVIIDHQAVEQVAEYKYLGVILQEDLKWTCHIKRQTKRAAQRLYHLRKLAQFQAGSKIKKKLFYTATIESVLLFGSILSGGAITQEDASKIRRIQKTAGRIIGQGSRWHHG